jgi:hypothetical protein
MFIFACLVVFILESVVVITNSYIAVVVCQRLSHVRMNVVPWIPFLQFTIDPSQIRQGSAMGLDGLCAQHREPLSHLSDTVGLKSSQLDLFMFHVSNFFYNKKTNPRPRPDSPIIAASSI